MKCFDNKRLYLDVIKNNPRDQYGISSQSKLQSLKLTVNCFCFVIKKKYKHLYYGLIYHTVRLVRKRGLFVLY